MNNLKTFTTDSYIGKLDIDYRDYIKTIEHSLRNVIENYLVECYNNNIDVSSADGYLYSKVFQMLAEEKIDLAYKKDVEEKSKNKRKRTYNV